MAFNKTFFSLLLFFAYTMAFSAYSEPSINQKAGTIKQIEQFHKQNSETLNIKEILSITKSVLTSPEQYPNETVATSFLLLAEVYVNQSDYAKAYQATLKGLEIKSKNSEITLCLLLKLAQVNTYNKNYNKLLATAKRAFEIINYDTESRYYIFALAYRSIAYTLLNQPEKSQYDLKMIEEQIRLSKSLSTHIKLLDIIAKSHYYLGDYKTSLALQLKVLKIRLDIDRKESIEKTYYQIGLSYQGLQQLDDAYNAYWQAEKYAKEKSATIAYAYATYKLGTLNLQQQDYDLAKKRIEKAKTLFKHNDLAQPYLSSLNALANIALVENDNLTMQLYLAEAETLLTNISLQGNERSLYILLANNYIKKHNTERAAYWQKRFIDGLNQPTKQVVSPINTAFHHLSLPNSSASDQNKKMAVTISKHSDKPASITKTSTVTLLISCAILLFVVLILWLRQHALKLKILFLEDKSPQKVFLSGKQTRNFYKTEYLKSRRFNYSLTVGYVSIDNWQELNFHFKKKIANEVSTVISELIYNALSEFEYAGKLNDGEYLILYPHHKKESIEVKFNQLTSKLTLSSFAALGGFTIKVNFNLHTVSSSDLDPYSFLSKLCQARYKLQTPIESNTK